MWQLVTGSSSAVLSVVLQLFAHFGQGYSLRCYSCSVNFYEHYDGDTRDKQCADKAFLLRSEDDTVRNCAPWETSCVTSMGAVHSTIATVSRGCIEKCSEECEVAGFGTGQFYLRKECVLEAHQDNLKRGRHFLAKSRRSKPVHTARSNTFLKNETTKLSGQPNIYNTIATDPST